MTWHVVYLLAPGYQVSEYTEWPDVVGIRAGRFYNGPVCEILEAG